MCWGSTPSTSSKPSYSKHTPRITKEDLFMVLALWMEKFPVESEEHLAKDNKDPKLGYQKVGAALVSPNDIVYAVDCTRDDVHGVTRLLMNHPDIAKGCKVFVSRKPCSFCMKLLVQSKVERVYYPPFEPEYHDDLKSNDEKSHVDTLFTRSNVAQSVLVPRVDTAVLELLKPEKGTKDDNKFFQKFWKEEWMKNVKDKLSWAVFDNNMADTCKHDFENITKWMTRILVKSGLPVDADAEVSFQQVGGEGKPEALQSKQFAHLLGMAEFLARRTDDPKTGVGAVIANEKMEIKALGLNGFPLKAGYGAFFRASDSDKQVEEKKYTFVIHAEQNALLMRNDKNLEGGTLFVTKTPCHECVPLIEMKGIKTVVLDKPLETKASTLDYSMFKEKVKEGVFTCYELRKTEGEEMKRKESQDLNYSKFPERVEEGVFTCFENKQLTILPSLSNLWQWKESKDLCYSKFKEKVKGVFTCFEKKPPTTLPSYCYFNCRCGFCN